MSQTTHVEGNYTVPKLSTSNSTDYFVWFRFFYAGQYHLKKCREGINKHTSIKERLLEGEALAAARLVWLQQGWNPITDPKFKARKFKQMQNVSTMNFCDALDFALMKKKPELAKKSYQDYKNIISIAKDKAERSGLSILTASGIKRIHILDLIESLAEERKMSNHRYNMYLGCIRACFTKLQTWSIVDFNPVSKIPVKKVAESNKYETYTLEEKERISQHLAKKHYQLFVFMLWLYHTGIRPKELLMLKISDIDFKRRIINIIPDLDRENTKTLYIRPVVIPDALWQFIIEMKLENYSFDFYVFGSPFKSGKGNRGGGSQSGKIEGNIFITKSSGAMRNDFLLPSPNLIKRDTITKLWKKLVKDELGIDKCLYAAKHTGGDDKILAGIDLDSLRNQYGHRSKYMTENYTKKLVEIYHSNIRTQAPEFISTKGAKIIKIA